MFIRCLVGLVLASSAAASGAAAKTCAPTNYAAGDIAMAVAASPNVSPVLKSSALTWGGAGRSESGGNLCASNGYSFGVLQLSRGNLPRGVTPAAYMQESLQQQVDTWVDQVGNRSVLSIGYQSLTAALAAGQTIGSTAVTSGMMAACFQFGPSICANDVAALQRGQPCGGAIPVNINRAWGRPGAATTDGNGQTICSWGEVIGANVETAAAACLKPGASCPRSNLTDYPTAPAALARVYDLS